MHLVFWGGETGQNRWEMLDCLQFPDRSFDVRMERKPVMGLILQQLQDSESLSWYTNQ